MMENANEKKWFVYMTDHHEGPFSAQQLQEMFETGRITQSSHAWCDGMADWTVIDQIASLAEVSKAKSKPSNSGPTLVAATVTAIGPSSASSTKTTTSAPDQALVESVSPVLEVVTEPATPNSQHSLPLFSLEPKLESESDHASEPAPVISLEAKDAKGGTNTSIESPAAFKLEEKREITNADLVFGTVHNPNEWTKTDVKQFSAGRDIPAGDVSRTDLPQNKAKNNKTRIGILLLLLAVVLGGGYYWKLKTASPASTPASVPANNSGPSWWSTAWNGTLATLAKIPGLGAYLSPLPQLTDIKPEEMEELKTAARASLKEGASVAIAMSQTDLASPKLYLASNLPEDTQLDVIFIGVPESLLNQTSFTQKIQTSVKKKLATTAPLRAQDGGPIPRGQYFVYVVESQGQPSQVTSELSNVPVAKGNFPAKVLSLSPQARGGKVFATKALFLGGPKDEGYAQRLTEYHEKLRTKAQQELSELNQYYSTLESQFTSSDSEFEKYLNGGKLTPAKTKAWNKFHETFTGLQNQLTQASAQWGGASPEVLEKEYFYHNLYAHLQKLVLHVNQVHEHHNSYFSGSVDRATFEERLAQLSSDCAQVLGAFKEKLEQAANTPPTANGMPVREGL